MYERVQNSIFKHFDFLIFDPACLMLALWLALIIHLLSIDEFPQFWNALLGDKFLVGGDSAGQGVFAPLFC